MRNTKIAFLFAFLLMCALSALSFGQQPERVFNWLPGNQEDVRLDPANYHAGQTYHASGDGGNMQVDIKSERPVTIFLAHSEEWNAAVQHPESLNSLQQLCTREHVVETRYTCFVPPVSMTLIIRDERYSPDHAVFAGLGAVLDPSNRVERAVGIGQAAVQSAQRRAHPILPLAVCGKLRPAGVSVDLAGQREVSADVVPESVWRVHAGP